MKRHTRGGERRTAPRTNSLNSRRGLKGETKSKQSARVNLFPPPTVTRGSKIYTERKRDFA